MPANIPSMSCPMQSACQVCYDSCCAQYLEWREKQYDVRERVDVFGKDSASEPLVRGALVYIASEDTTKNLNFLGTAPREAIAQQIAAAVGPSGRNDEYLYGLANALEQVWHLLPSCAGAACWLAHASCGL